MPAVSDKQRKFMGADLARKRAGKKTKTGMSEGQLSDYAHKPMMNDKKKKKAMSTMGKKMSFGFR